MYPFMVKHLKLDPKGVLNKKTGVFDETGNRIEKVSTMRTFDEKHPIPKHALKPGSPVKF